MRRSLSPIQAIVAASTVAAAVTGVRAEFSYSFLFGVPSELVVNGDSFFDAEAYNTLTLTNADGQSGAVWNDTPQLVANGWTTTFTFRIWGGSVTQVPGDGFAFVLHDDPAGTAALGGAGGALGYGSGNDGPTFVPGITRSLAIEFDTFNFEGEGPQVAVHSRGSDPNSAEDVDAIASAYLSDVSSVDILDGAQHSCMIEYKPADGENPALLVVYVDNQLLLSTTVDLGDIDGDSIVNENGEMYAGFTGSTGLADSIQMIDEWGFADNTGGCRAPSWFTVGWGGCGLGCQYGVGVNVLGSTPMTFAWFKDGVEIVDEGDGHYSGFNTASFVVHEPTLADNGYYKGVMSNPCGQTETIEVFLGTCPADIDDGTFSGASDGGVDINDLLYFLTSFESGTSDADLSDAGGGAVRDGGVDINDLLFFLRAFESGC